MMKKQYFLLIIATVVIMLGMQSINSHLKTGAAPNGIVSFEFASNISTAQAIIASWSGSAMFYTGLSMGLDFLFLVAYSITIAIGCILIGSKLESRWLTLGYWLAGAQILAAILDIIENLTLIGLLAGSTNVILPPLACWCAGPKFILVGSGLIYLIYGLLAILYHRIRT
ncbi:MAG: hypothetical protein H8E14_00815 [Candidatus Marinimicrobia bacterium]|nr:hypothetical protein [Candidatus Neomarinimicrobiota bacterium]